MKALHVIPSISPIHGGPSFALPLIAKGLTRIGIKVDVATTDDDGRSHLKVPLNQPVDQEGVTHYYFSRQTNLYKFSQPLGAWLSKNIARYDVVHIHALFSYSSSAAAFYAKKASVPYIVRPLGVLNRWGMRKRRPLLKRLSFNLIESRILKHAAAVHYTSEQEKAEALEAGVAARAVVIPLGIDVGRAPTQPDHFLQLIPQAAGRKVVLFLSRIDPKKGLDTLVRAFATVNKEDPSTLLVIAGSGPPEYIAELKGLAETVGITAAVSWVGFLDGPGKLAALSVASLFVLPSHSENFGIAAVEALAAGLPCIVSDQVGIASDVASYEAGSVTPCDPGLLASEILRLLASPELGRQMALNARRLARERFSTETMATSLRDLYQEVLNESQHTDRRSVSRRSVALSSEHHDVPIVE